jgi:hypothetical protein
MKHKGDLDWSDVEADAQRMNDELDLNTCQCAGIETFIRSDTLGEYVGVTLFCTLCTRTFEVDEKE